MNPLLETLTKAGLESHIAEIYLILLELGETTVPAVQAKTTLSRASVYNALSTLLVEGYIEYRKVGRVAYYKPVHPQKLEELVQQKKRDVALLESEMGETIRSLTGVFNLAFNKPGVRLYEGKEGVMEAFEEILKIGQPIQSIEDNGEIDEFLTGYFPLFVQKRIEKKIFNQIISPSTNPHIDTGQKELRETRTLDGKEFPLSLNIMICMHTLLLATVQKGQATAVIIEDKIIAENFRLLFKFFWDHAKKQTLTPNTPMSSPFT